MANPVVASAVPKQANLSAALWVSNQIDQAGAAKKGAWDAKTGTYYAPVGPSADPQDDFELAPAIASRNGLRSKAVNCGIPLAALNSTGTVYDFASKPFDIIVVATSLGAGLRYVFSNIDHFSPYGGWGVAFSDAIYANLNLRDTDTTNFPPNGIISYGGGALVTNEPLVLRVSMNATGGVTIYKNGTQVYSYSTLAFVGPINYAGTLNRRPMLFRTAPSGGGNAIPVDIYAAFLYVGANLTEAEGQFFSASATETANGKFYDAFNFSASGSLPVVTNNPAHQTVNAPATASFSVVGTGYDSIQWQRSTDSGASYASVPDGTGATTTTYTTTATAVSSGNHRNGYRYRAALTNAAGTVYSQYALLTVNSTADTTAPTLTGAIAVSNLTKDSLTLTCPVATDNVAVTQYRYRTNAHFWTVIASGARTVDITGLTPGVAYTFDMAAGDAAGNWSNDLTVAQTMPIYGFDFHNAVGLIFGMRSGAEIASIGVPASANVRVNVFPDSDTRTAPIAVSPLLPLNTAGRAARWTHAALDPGWYQLDVVDPITKEPCSFRMQAT